MSIAHIQAAYKSGVDNFGESYVVELAEKEQFFPRDVRWHFIGKLQGNKIRKLASIRNLYMVHSISCLKEALALDNYRKNLPRLSVLLQVNASGEKSKGGVAYDFDEIQKIVQLIQEKCWNLKFRGFMLIGTDTAQESVKAAEFEKMRLLRLEMSKRFSPESDFFLSMGMSRDWQLATSFESTHVRVGTAIFGERPINQETP